MLPRLAFAAAVTVAGPALGLTDADVGEAIDRVKQYLYAQQEPTGGWDRPLFEKTPGTTATGQTALVVTALLASGESFQDPRLSRAINFLQAHPGKGTYTVAQRAHVWAQLPDDYFRRLEQEAAWLLRAHDRGQFDYDAPVRYVSNSRTHYGVLGLWEYAKRGGRVPPRFWEQAAQHFVRTQNEDGGWGYYTPARKSYPDARETNSYGAMVAAGVTVLLIAQQEQARDHATPIPELASAIERGLAWLDRHFRADEHPFPGGRVSRWRHAYYLYAIERVGLAGGIQRFNEQDWFQAGAEHIRRKMRKDGSVSLGAGTKGRIVDSAFALMFLARGRVPVWINKLKVEGTAWNNRPNDLYFLTRHLSDVREHELNWQVVDIDSDPAGWLNAPVTWWSSHEAVELNETQRAHLRRYVEMGGLLVVNIEGRSARFTRTVHRLAQELFPHESLERVPPDHDLVRLLFDTGNRGAVPVMVVRHAARDLMLLLPRDWGMDFQRDDSPGDSLPWKLMTNLYAAVTERGVLSNRLVHPGVKRQPRSPVGAVRVVRGTYDGHRCLEPRAWEPLADHLFNVSGRELEIVEKPLESIGEARAALVHLSGVDAVELSADQLGALQNFARAGGTVLIETLGGRGMFAPDLQRQLGEFLGQTAAPLTDHSALISGAGLEAGQDCRRVRYRPFSVAEFSAGSRSRLTAFWLEGRPAIVLSHEDLSLGALGLRRWSVHGYAPTSARQLLTNLILVADQRSPTKVEAKVH